MLLVTVPRYQKITLDTTSPADAVTAAIMDAQALLEEDLGGRPLEQKERTERMYPDGSGRLFPIVTPITVPPDGFKQDGASIYGAYPFFGLVDLLNPLGWVDLTYTAGFVERTANPTATNRLPEHVERDLAWVAFFLLNPSGIGAPMPDGATSVKLGDAAVTFGPDGAPQGVDVQVSWSKSTLKMKRRRLN